MKSITDSAAVQFRRDGHTWYLYLLLAIVGFKQSVLGSVTPFLRDEMTLSINEVGWHFSIYAVGLILSGIVGRWLLNRLAAPQFLRPAAMVMVAGIASLTLGSSIIATLFSALALGLTGGLVQVAVQTELANHHGPQHGIALTEAHIFGGLGVFCGPLTVGLTVAFGYDWRVAMAVPAVALAVLLIAFRSSLPPKQLTQGEIAKADTRVGELARLPVGVYACWLMILLGIAAEWGIGFWGAQFLEAGLSVDAATGVTLMTVFFGGTVFGRLVSSRLLTLFDGRTMLMVAMIGGLVSILILWGSSFMPVTIAALALAGMCLGNFFPLILNAAIGQAPHRINVISSGATQAVGVALLVVPVTLGQIGQWIGLVNAVGLLMLLPLLMMVSYLATVRAPSAGSMPVQEG